MKKLFGTILILAGIAATADANPRCRVACAAVVVERPVVVQPVYNVPIINYQRYDVPVYNAIYSGGTYSESMALAQSNMLLAQKLEALSGQLKGLIDGGGVQQGGGTKPQVNNPGLLFLSNNCAKCHDSKVSATMGRDKNGIAWTFFDLGKMVADADTRAIMLDAIHGDRMPKGGPKATDEDYANVVSYFATLSREAKKASAPMNKVP